MTPDNVNSEAGNCLASIWKEVTPKPLLVNCYGIASFSDYSLHAVVESSSQITTPIVFWNMNEQLAVELCRQLSLSLARGTARPFGLRPLKPLGNTVTFPNISPADLPISKLLSQASETDKDHIQEIIRDTFHKHASGKFEPLHSTPILASGIYNARRIICEPAHFNWSVLHLEEALDALVPDWDQSRHCLLTGSLRACPFAAALAFMKTPARSVELLDHFGPHPVLLEEHDLGPGRRGIDYIYVGDFMIGGTEIKIANSWAARRGCRVIGALLLGTLWDETRYQFREIAIHKLVSLHNLHPAAKYSLYA